ncbi:MAG: XdhC family protein [Streptosporangiaceae bacterium]|jgi:xanthine dehydrogenase accessory factor
MTPDDACEVAHGTAEPDSVAARLLVAVFASPMARFLLRYGADVGYTGVLVEPDERRAAKAAVTGLDILEAVPGGLSDADVVVTDHHRPELGIMIAQVLAADPRWVGVVGNPRHEAPHIPALESLGVPAEKIARVHRPIGLNIGSRRPPEIAIATLAGLLADRNGRPGGFDFT